MKLLLINGSPRGINSNTKLLLDYFEQGVYAVNNRARIETVYLNKLKDHESIKEKFIDSDFIILGFPLYADAMPGIVMKFIEEIPDSEGKKIGFLVQSGFPEIVHSIYIERFLEKLSKRMKWNYLGTIIKGGVEGIQIMPAYMTKKIYSNFFHLGKSLGLKMELDTAIIGKMRKPFKFSPFRLFFAKAMQNTGIMNFYWNSKLKENNALQKSFDTPYN